MSEDERFATLVSQWLGDFLGREKDEGIGLLWKEGGWVELIAELHRVAPRTARRFAEHLAHTSNERLPLDVLDALPIADRAAREERFRQLDLAPPFAPFRQAMESLEPPMPTRFARRIEAWLDLASGIETRGAQPDAAPSAVGREVTHGKFGRGVIRSVEPGPMQIATVAFEDGSTRRLAMRFLT